MLHAKLSTCFHFEKIVWKSKEIILVFMIYETLGSD